MLKISLCLLGLLTAAACAAQVSITEYPIPTGGSDPFEITTGLDGNLWFAEQEGNKIATITTAGVITELPGYFPQAEKVIPGPDGNMWFILEAGSAIGKMTTAGVLLAEYPTSYYPQGITLGPDGNLWFTSTYTNQIGRITPDGVITFFGPTTNSSTPAGIAAGPDGNLWFAEEGAGATGPGSFWGPGGIGMITPSGVITEFSMPTSGSVPLEITAGPDGNLWFTEYVGGNIGRITPSGVITEFSLPTSNSQLFGITAGPDGNLWFVERQANNLGRITPDGVATEFPIPTSGSGPEGITTGPDGNLWFTEAAAGNIGKATLGLASQTITFGALSNLPFSTAPFTISATASSGLPVSFNSQTPSVCTVSGSQVALVFVGTCTIQATQAGNSNYLAATPVSRSFQVLFTGVAPVSGSKCNGAYSGTFYGNLTVSSGQTCMFFGGGVTGNVQQIGGYLKLVQSHIGNDLQISGASTFSIGPSTIIGGNLQIQNLLSGSAQNQVCGTTVHNDLHFNNNGTAILIGSPSTSCLGNSIGGNLTVDNNSAVTQIDNNTVSGDLQAQGNTAATQIENDAIGGNLQLQNNTSSTAVFSNNVNTNLQCSGNNSLLITGGGNTAAQKQGQCVNF